MKNCIAVFDSGVGGLTVLRSLVHAFPNEKFIYLGDTARLPYGNKSPEVIRRFTLQALNFFLPMGCKAIVIACNSASCHFPETEHEGIPVYTMITPAAETALQETNGIIGVLGTRATIQSGAYERTLSELATKQNKKIQVYSNAAPLFVPLAEEGWTDDPITNLIAFRYLQPLLQKNIDTLILGCTHYPLLIHPIQKVCTSSVKLITSGEALSSQMEKDFQTGRVKKTEALDSQTIELFATDSSNLLETFAYNLLPQVNPRIQIQALKTIEL